MGSGRVVRVLVNTERGTAQAEYVGRFVTIYAASDNGRKWKVVQEIEVGDPDLFPGMSRDEVAHFTAVRWLKSKTG